MNLTDPFLFPFYFFLYLYLPCFPLYHLAGLLLLYFDIFFPIPPHPFFYCYFILLDFLVFDWGYILMQLTKDYSVSVWRPGSIEGKTVTDVVTVYNIAFGMEFDIFLSFLPSFPLSCILRCCFGFFLGGRTMLGRFENMCYMLCRGPSLND